MEASQPEDRLERLERGEVRPGHVEASQAEDGEAEAQASQNVEAMQPEDRLERGEELTAARPSVATLPGEPEGAVENIQRSRTAMAMFAQRPHWARSAWRFPTNRGQVPRYMQRAFRWKTFGLMTLQLLMVLLIAVPLRSVHIVDRLVFHEMQNFLRQGIVYCFGVVNLVFILLLHCYKDRFPANYVFLSMTTITSGVFWSMAYSKNFMTLMQFEILAILCITMFFATVISTVLSGLERKLQGATVLVLSFFPGWCIGCCAILFQRLFFSPPLPLELVGACCVSAILIGILFLDVGPLLVRCDPDDFMRVIVSMNSTMMVVVSIPFFFLAFCMLRLDHREDNLTSPVPELPEESLRPRVVQAAQRLGVAY